MRTSDPTRGASHGAAAGMLDTKSATQMATVESTPQVTASESSAASMTAAASEPSASSVTTTTTTTSGGEGVCPRCCTERDGDEENHDLARDWLLLYAGR